MRNTSRRSFVALCSSFLLNKRISLWGASRRLGVGTANIALHRAADQSSAVDDDHTAHLATDGRTETYWESKAGNDAWIAVDLGEQCVFSGIRLNWGESYATAYRLQLSDDGSDDRNWGDFSTLQNGKGGVQTIPVCSIKARHVRLLVTGFSQPDRGCVFKEIDIAGSRRPSPTLGPQPTPSTDGSLLVTGGNWKLQNAML